MKEKNNKTDYIQIRITSEEKEILKKEANKRGISMSRILREYLIDNIFKLNS